jgi:hypothetical protein
LRVALNPGYLTKLESPAKAIAETAPTSDLPVFPQQVRRVGIMAELSTISTPALFIPMFGALNSGSLSVRWQLHGIVELDHGEQMKILGFQHLRELRAVLGVEARQARSQELIVRC